MSDYFWSVPQRACQHHRFHSICSHPHLLNMPITRRKKFNYKKDKVIKPPKTGLTEMTVAERAFAVGAITAMRGEYNSLRQLATSMERSHSTLLDMLEKVEKKRENTDGFLWDSIMYQNELGRGRPSLLSQDRKDRIIAIVTSSQENREKEAWQAVNGGDFDEILPEMSVETF